MLDKSIRRNKTCCRRKKKNHRSCVLRGDPPLSSLWRTKWSKRGSLYLSRGRSGRHLRGVVRRQPILDLRQVFLQPLDREISVRLDHRHRVSHRLDGLVIVFAECLKLQGNVSCDRYCDRKVTSLRIMKRKSHLRRPNLPRCSRRSWSPARRPSGSDGISRNWSMKRKRERETRRYSTS